MKPIELTATIAFSFSMALHGFLESLYHEPDRETVLEMAKAIEKEATGGLLCLPRPTRTDLRELERKMTRLMSIYCDMEISYYVDMSLAIMEYLAATHKKKGIVDAANATADALGGLSAYLNPDYDSDAEKATEAFKEWIRTVIS